ncbi:hypothetical protein BU25DRAFT_417277 [Macroventuria anomochaeta]|uniref:Uncharacterized protein n=1 Tax=Macroventuria anomochaeta TaxID=301207 RepID=A0ACB6SFA5_9PLEO|nr:uncharacterized protein BU25DRAFT_417277 [Macroventuria anomochaeta]KAF2632673.1 hypothetical protein BU25DRAFT_417277 [Macroventuria anomochaeta]
MEALVALGLASNTVQFLDFATKVCTEAIDIYHNASGKSVSDTQTERLVKGFMESIDAPVWSPAADLIPTIDHGKHESACVLTRRSIPGIAIKCVREIDRSDSRLSINVTPVAWTYDREDEIATAELHTFKWILQHFKTATNKWDDFIQWFEQGESIYWVNEKAGSGKSTLMEYISHYPAVRGSLRYWSGATILIVARFFFWHGGNALKRTQEGSLRPLLFRVLTNNHELVPIVLSDSVSKTDPFTWTLPMLTQAFKRLVEQKEIALIDAEQHNVYHDFSSISFESQITICKNMTGRTKSHCAGFLEVTNISGKTQPIQSLHKSVEDFLETPEIMWRVQKSLSGKGFFVPEYAIITGHLLELMTLKAGLCEKQSHVDNVLTQETWMDEVQPIALSAARCRRCADLQIAGPASAAATLLKFAPKEIESL